MKSLLYNIELTDETRVNVSKGNTKIGKIHNFNLLAGVKPVTAKGNILTDIKGTCGHADCSECSRCCYAIHTEQQHHNTVIKPWGENTLMVRHRLEDVENQLKAYIVCNNVRSFRFHSSGELESVEQCAAYIRVAEANPKIPFYIYTKAFGIVTDYIKSGLTVPQNFIFNLSEWHGNIAKYLKRVNDDTVTEFFHDCNVFSYYDGAKSCMEGNFIQCPAVNAKGRETGVTCDQCGLCRTRGKLIRVYPH